MSDITKQPIPTATSESHRLVLGPSLLDGLPGSEDWRAFTRHIKDPSCLALTELWIEKVHAAGGIPLRNDFGFEEIAKWGSTLMLYKLDENDRWLTTFAGSTVVEVLGFEPTGKYLEDYGADNSLKFWLDNMQYITDAHMPLIESYNLEFVEKDYVRVSAVNLPLKTGTRDFPDSYFEILSFGAE